MWTTKPFFLNDTLSFASTVLEDCVNRTMVGEAFGVDSGDTWELRCRTSDDAEEYSNPQRWMLDVEGRVTDVLKSDEGELAGRPSVHVLAIEANKINEERTVVDVAFYVDDLREYFNRLQAEMERFWPQVRSLGTEPTPTLPQAQSTTRGPTINTQSRAEYFKNLKDKHPEWSYARIALVASLPIEEGGYGEIVTEHTVRNAYRAMGWKWARSDRVR